MAQYDEDDEPDYEFGPVREVHEHVNPPEAERISPFPPDDVVRATQAEIEAHIEARQKRREADKKAKKEANALGLRDPKSGRTISVKKLAEQAPEVVDDEDGVEFEELRREARKKAKTLIAGFEALSKSDNERVKQDALGKLFEIGYGKIGTMQQTDPDKDFVPIRVVFYRDLEDPDLFEVNEID